MPATVSHGAQHVAKCDAVVPAGSHVPCCKPGQYECILHGLQLLAAQGALAWVSVGVGLLCASSAPARVVATVPIPAARSFSVLMSTKIPDTVNP